MSTLTIAVKFAATAILTVCLTCAMNAGSMLYGGSTLQGPAANLRPSTSKLSPWNGSRLVSSNPVPDRGLSSARTGERSHGSRHARYNGDGSSVHGGWIVEEQQPTSAPSLIARCITWDHIISNRIISCHSMAYYSIT